MATPLISDEHFRKITNISQAKLFLGQEFLTWLWYMTEEQMKVDLHLPQLGEKKSVELWVDDRLLLESSVGTSHEHLIKGGSPSHSKEATAALWEGKSVKELKLGVRVEGIGDFVTNLNCNQLSPKSLQLPEPEGEESEAMHLSMRINNTNLFLNILDALFLMFIDQRTDKAWEAAGAEKIQTWINSRSKKSGDLLH